MWQLDNRTPFAAERGWVRDRDGAEVWLVAVKATFQVRPDGSTAPSAEQPPVLALPVHHGEPARSSIRHEADLVLTKTTTDILLVGHAHAPAGQAVSELDCGFKVGPVQKLVRVFGDRRWGRSGASKPQPWQSMPLQYERAYGGCDARSARPECDWDGRNPVGMGFFVAAEHAQDQPLPNLERPDALIASWSDRPAPASFGPLAAHWQPRVAYAGTYDEAWQKARAPLLAADMDERWYQCAPADQQSPQFLKGGEPVTLLNLNPRGRIEFRLPQMALEFETRFFDGSRERHAPPALHTVTLEPDHADGPRVSLVWHTALKCHFKVHKLDRTVITLQGQGSADDAAGRPGAGAAAIAASTH